MAQVISVAPTSGGWMVRAELMDAPMAFVSGAKAEAAARRLAARLARDGEPVEVEIYLRDGALAGRFIAAPPSPAPAPSESLTEPALP